jgi:RNA polymerase sigma-70 factor, ECF subfamily
MRVLRRNSAAVIPVRAEKVPCEVNPLTRSQDVAPRPAVQGHEAEIIASVIGGDGEAFYELVRPYERSVFLAALLLVKNEADAQDVAQEAILKAFKNLPHFRQEAKFSTWLIQITINEGKMWLRKDRRHLYESLDRHHENEEGDYIPKDFADWREIPSEALERSEHRQALTKAMGSLPERYRAVMILRDVQHLSTKETAQLLDLTEEAVKTRLNRARLMMRDALAAGFDRSWNWRTADGEVRSL